MITQIQTFNFGFICCKGPMISKAGYNAKKMSEKAPKLPVKKPNFRLIVIKLHVPGAETFQSLLTGLH